MQPTRVRRLQPRITAALQSAAGESHSPALTTTTTEHYFRPTPTSPEVIRMKDANFMCSESSLFFVSLCGLQTTLDTDKIALNLMDYFLQLPTSEYPTEIWYGHLHATCFLLASELTGCDNEVEDVCRAVEMQAAGLVAMGANEESLKVQPQQVLAGLRMMVGWGEEIRGCVGCCWDALEALVDRISRGELEPEEARCQDHAEDNGDPTRTDMSHDDGELVDLDMFDEV